MGKYEETRRQYCLQSLFSMHCFLPRKVSLHPDHITSQANSQSKGSHFFHVISARKSFLQQWVKRQGTTFLWHDHADVHSSSGVNQSPGSSICWVLSSVICVHLLHFNSLCSLREGCKSLAGCFRNPVLPLLCWTLSHPIRNKTFSFKYWHTWVYYPFSAGVFLSHGNGHRNDEQNGRDSSQTHVCL